MQVEDQVRSILDEILGLDGRASSFESATPLLGSLPELDSMAVIGVLNAIEEYFDFVIGDDEVDGGTFETFGTLAEFVRTKLQ
ncbi:MAG: acyl carrier protein [Rhodocyclaceae bacterium]|nr:acyl carrier protein [Rhodocyclaceae bacterium]